MSAPNTFAQAKAYPPTALAPMQDVTTLPFMRIIDHWGSPDYFYTEYFRVHQYSTLESHILASITANTTGKPVFAQMIGEHIPYLLRTVAELQQHPIAGIDLNMGCPAPKVYKKNVGGGLLRDPDTIDHILGALRQAYPGHLSVKFRIGFADWEHFPQILNLINKHQLDSVALHGRTVKEMYRGDVHYDAIKQAVETLRCPVFANGNITSWQKAITVQEYTGCHGLMVGRSAIRNPWIFQQIHQHYHGQAVRKITLADAYQYIHQLIKHIPAPDLPEKHSLNLLKKFLAFIGQSVDPEGHFLYHARRSKSFAQLEDLCQEHLLLHGNDSKPYALEPYPKVIARPNHESAYEGCSL